MNLEKAATHLEAAAQQLREANSALPIGWDEDLNLLQVAASFERMASAVRQGQRQAAIEAKRMIVTRREAASLLSSLRGRDAKIDAEAIQRKKDVAKNASMARREKAIKKKNDRELREILAVALSGRPLDQVAKEYWIREETLRDWVESHRSVSKLNSPESQG